MRIEIWIPARSDALRVKELKTPFVLSIFLLFLQNMVL